MQLTISNVTDRINFIGLKWAALFQIKKVIPKITFIYSRTDPICSFREPQFDINVSMEHQKFIYKQQMQQDFLYRTKITETAEIQRRRNFSEENNDGRTRRYGK